jgi:hypothetical protein
VSDTEKRRNRAPINLVGKRYGRLVVLKYNRREKPPSSFWLCRCDCGVEKSILGASLRIGNTKSCGCLSIDKAREKGVDLTGRRFGKLVVKKLIGTKNSARHWLCECDCGGTTQTRGYSLTSGRIGACACGRREKFKIKRQYETGLDPAWYRAYSRFIHCADVRHHDNEISGEVFKEMCLISCWYCGGFSESGVNGIDRINSDLGYLKNNVRSCCKRCNYAKNNMTEQEFGDWVKRIYAHMFGKMC